MLPVVAMVTVKHLSNVSHKIQIKTYMCLSLTRVSLSRWWSSYYLFLFVLFVLLLCVSIANISAVRRLRWAAMRHRYHSGNIQ